MALWMNGRSGEPTSGGRRCSGDNLLVEELDGAACRLLRPRLHRTRVGKGDLLLRAGQPATNIYFPETAVISIVEVMADRRWIDVALTGWEGLVGWPTLSGCEREPYSAVVQQAGTVLAVPAQVMRELVGAKPTLAIALLGYVATVAAQLSRTVADGREARVDRRVARWLLMLHDRNPTDTLALTHDRLAEMLGVRRASITDCLHVLEGEGVVRCARGEVELRNRAALEVLAGDLYAADARPLDRVTRRGAQDAA